MGAPTKIVEPALAWTNNRVSNAVSTVSPNRKISFVGRLSRSCSIPARHQLAASLGAPQQPSHRSRHCEQSEAIQL